MVIICKSFGVMKSYIIILFVDCNTHLHTLSKKQKKFQMLSLSKKTKGTGHQVGGNVIFGADGNLRPTWPGVPKFGWVRNYYSVDTLLEGFLI